MLWFWSLKVLKKYISKHLQKEKLLQKRKNIFPNDKCLFTELNYCVSSLKFWVEVLQDKACGHSSGKNHSFTAAPTPRSKVAQDDTANSGAPPASFRFQEK